ncbi:40449_t:CDS:1, partial [Gigaspora margarita]
AEDFRIHDISLNIYIYTDMEANNNVILVPFNSSSNMEFIDTIKDYDADVIYEQTGNPFNLDIYKRQDKRNIVTWLINGE